MPAVLLVALVVASSPLVPASLPAQLAAQLSSLAVLAALLLLAVLPPTGVVALVVPVAQPQAQRV